MLTENDKMKLLDEWVDEERSLEELAAALDNPNAAELEAMTREHKLAISHLKAGNLDAAYPLLSAIQSNPEHTYHSSISKKNLRIIQWKHWFW